MTDKKNSKTRKSPSPTLSDPTSYDSMDAAAAAMGFTKTQLQKAKAAGCKGFRGSRIYPSEVLPWLEANRDTLSQITGKAEADLEKRLQEIRKLRLANDQKAGRLVERAWVAGRIQAMFGDINAFRSRSEAEHATRFAAAAGDIALCRTHIRGIWDQIIADLQSLHKHLEEG